MLPTLSTKSFGIETSAVISIPSGEMAIFARNPYRFKAGPNVDLWVRTSPIHTSAPFNG